jgi:2-dehydropantoate 2-reductase
LDGSKSRRVQRLAEALERGGIPAPQVPCIRSEIFIKSINSLAFNVAAVLGGADNGTIADVPECVETLETMMEECEGIAHKLGLTLQQTAKERITQTLSARMHTMSMLHDLRKRKPLELRPLWESVSNLASVIGVKLPVSKALVGCALLREKAERERRQAEKPSP